MNRPDISTREVWLAARMKLLVAEKGMTRATYDRGSDILNGTFNYLDLTALGRQKDWEEPPGRANTSAGGWWRLHGEY